MFFFLTFYLVQSLLIRNENVNVNFKRKWCKKEFFESNFFLGLVPFLDLINGIKFKLWPVCTFPGGKVGRE